MVDTPAVTQAKVDLRRQVRSLRRSLSPAQKAAEEAHVCQLLITRYGAGMPLIIASYAALPEELSVDAWHLQRWAAGDAVWLPRVTGVGTLSWHSVTTPEQLATGAYGIREPRADLVPAMPLPPQAVILVPGVAFSIDGWRLGQGGGFYDRLLATHQGPTIGLAFSCQRLPAIPHDTHDRPVTEVLFGG